MKVGGRPRAAVEVLVRAADGEIDAVLGEPDRDRAGGMRQVPHDERTCVVGEGRDRRQVGDRGGPVVDVAQRHEGDVARMRVEDLGHVRHRRSVDDVRVQPGDLAIPIPGQSLQHVPVGREVRPVGDDEPPARPGLQRRAREPVEVDRRRVADRRPRPAGPRGSRCRAGRRPGAARSSQCSQPRISSPAHSSRATRATRSIAARGGRPSEFPSRYRSSGPG